MKIIVIGSHGTGKTTLCNKLFNYLKEKEAEEMKIGVTGAHGVGKTRLSLLLAGRLNWRYLPEAPRQAHIIGFNMKSQTTDTSIDSQIWMFAKQLEMELFTPEPWIADKCLIDLLAYARYLIPEERTVLKTLEDTVRRNASYDLVFYLPSGQFSIEDDGWRPVDPKYQLKIDKMIRQAMAEFGISFHRIVGDPEERFKEAKKLIDQKLKS